MRSGGMDVQFAEFAAEGEMLLRRDVLVAEKNHEIFGKRAVDFVHLTIGARFVRNQPADIDAGYFRTDDRGQLLDADGLIRLGVIGGVTVARSLLAGE